MGIFGFFRFFWFLGVDGRGGDVGVVEVAWGGGLSVGGGGVYVSENADLSGGGDDAWVLEGLGGGFITGSPGFAESSGKTSQTVYHSFSISAAMHFWSAWKGEVVNVVEVLNDECVEVLENLRLDLYSNGTLLYISEMGVEARWGEGAWGDACWVGYFWSMRVVCYYLRVSWYRNVVLLVKLKDAPGAVDGDRCWAEMGSITEYGRLICVERSGRLAIGIS